MAAKQGKHQKIVIEWRFSRMILWGWKYDERH